MRSFYSVEFLDHAIGKEAIRCTVHGVVVRSNDLSITLSWWLTHHEDEEVVALNNEEVTILKSTIIKMHKIIYPDSYQLT